MQDKIRSFHKVNATESGNTRHYTCASNANVAASIMPSIHLTARTKKYSRLNRIQFHHSRIALPFSVRA